MTVVALPRRPEKRSNFIDTRPQELREEGSLSTSIEQWQREEEQRRHQELMAALAAIVKLLQTLVDKADNVSR